MVEQVGRHLGGANPDAEVRDGQFACRLEDRAVVFIVAHEDKAARREAGQQGPQCMALSGVRRVDLDHLATETAVEAGLVEQRPQDVQHLLTADRGVSEMNRAAGGLDLDPRTGGVAQQLRRLGVERLQGVQLGASGRREAAVSDEQRAGNGHELGKLRIRSAAEDDDLREYGCEPPERVHRLWKGRGKGRLGNDLRQRAVEVGDEQELIGPDR